MTPTATKPDRAEAERSAYAAIDELRARIAAAVPEPDRPLAHGLLLAAMAGALTAEAAARDLPAVGDGTDEATAATLAHLETAAECVAELCVADSARVERVSEALEACGFARVLDFVLRLLD